MSNIKIIYHTPFYGISRKINCNSDYELETDIKWNYIQFKFKNKWLKLYYITPEYEEERDDPQYLIDNQDNLVDYLEIDGKVYFDRKKDIYEYEYGKE